MVFSGFRARLGALGLALVLSASSGTAFADAPSGYQWNHVAIVAGGYIPGVIFSEAEQDLIYLRTDMGGAYRWVPSTGSWKPLTDWVGPSNWNFMGIESIAADPVDPNRVYLAVGTYTNDWAGNGAILRSTDRGDHFQKTDLPFKLGGNMPGRSVGERLVVDPSSHNVLYFGARSGKGLWKSTDFGETWAQVTSFPSGGDYVQDPQYAYTADLVGLDWVVFDPRGSGKDQPSKTLYVGVANAKSPSIYRSTDAGATWQPVPGQPLDGFLPIHGALDSQGILYVTYNNNSGPYDGTKGDVWKYDTNSSTWTRISPVSSTLKDDYFGYGGLTLDKTHPGTLVVSALNSWWPDTQFWRSTNGGATWNPIWKFVGYPNRPLRYDLDYSAAPWLDWGAKPTAPEITPKLGWMVGEIRIDPFNSNRLMYGTGATLYGTNDLGNWDSRSQKVHLKVMGLGIEEASVVGLVSPPKGPQLFSLVGDINGFTHDDITKAPKTMFLNPGFTPTSLDFAENHPEIVVRVGKGDKAKSPNARIAISKDSGHQWTPGTDPGNLPASGEAGGGTVAVSSDGQAVLWAPDQEGVTPQVSTDQGAHWETVTGLSPRAQVAADRVNPLVFYGFSAGHFLVSHDGAKTFQPGADLPAPQGTIRFKVMAGYEGEIWLAAPGKGGDQDPSAGIWRSSDGGKTFAKLTTIDLADTIGFGKAKPGQPFMAVYTNGIVAGVRGIYRSDDAGATWVRINDDDHQYGTCNADITGDPRVYGRVYLASNGRGIPYGDLK